MEKFRKWLDNFWYHYKWHTIFSIFGVLVVIFIVVNVISDTTYDIYIMYGGKYITGSESEAVNEAFCSIAGDDYDGDGKITANISHIPCISGDEDKLTGQERKLNYDADETLQNQLPAGNYYIFILERELYERFNDNNPSIFVPLSALFEKIPESAYDEWGIYLDKLDFYKKDGVDNLKGDLIICLANPTEGFFASLFGKDTNKKYEYHKQIFIDIINYAE